MGLNPIASYQPSAFSKNQGLIADGTNCRGIDPLQFALGVTLSQPGLTGPDYRLGTVGHM
jgi:hypothetical protein